MSDFAPADPSVEAHSLRHTIICSRRGGATGFKREIRVRHGPRDFGWADRQAAGQSAPYTASLNSVAPSLGHTLGQLINLVSQWLEVLGQDASEDGKNAPLIYHRVFDKFDIKKNNVQRLPLLSLFDGPPFLTCILFADYRLPRVCVGPLLLPRERSHRPEDRL